VFNVTTLETVWLTEFDSPVLLPPLILPDGSGIFVATDYIELELANNTAKVWRLDAQTGDVDWVHHSKIPGSLIWDMSLSYDAQRLYMVQSSGDLGSILNLELTHSFLTRTTTFDPTSSPTVTPTPTETTVSFPFNFVPDHGWRHGKPIHSTNRSTYECGGGVIERYSF
jgi:outer membrane protein assembly factor BamB